MNPAPMAHSPDEIEQVVSQWQRAAPRLVEVRRREVSELTDADAATATLELLAALDALPALPVRPMSGLVEQQRLFMLVGRP